MFDRYAPPAATETAQRGFDPRLAQLQQPYAAPLAARDAHQSLRGSTFDQWQQPVSSNPPAPSQGYDFGQYMGAAAHPTAAASSDYEPQAQHLDYGHQAAFEAAHWPAPQGHAQQGYGAAMAHGQGYAQTRQGYGQQGYDQGQGGQLQPVGEQSYDQDDPGEYEEEEDAPRGRRGLIIVSALVGAIAIGGGMAFAYKTFIKPSSSGATIAKVSAPKGPSKMPPADPSGRQFPNQDSKLQSRLGEGSAPASSLADAEGGVKRVTTQIIGRDGSIVAPQIQASTPVPGLTIVDGMNAPRQQSPAAPQTAVAAIDTAPPVIQPRTQPQARIPAAVAAAEPAPIAAVAASPKKTPPPKKQAVRDDLAATGAAPAPAAASNTRVASAPSAIPAPTKLGANGYVAVLASKTSRADATKANADLERNFDVLKGKIFDVQEADLTAQGKGVVFRSVVGPPGSKEFASGICAQLKAVGHANCWVNAY